MNYLLINGKDAHAYYYYPVLRERPPSQYLLTSVNLLSNSLKINLFSVNLGSVLLLAGKASIEKRTESRKGVA